MNKYDTLKEAVAKLKTSKYPQEDKRHIAAFVSAFFTEYEIEKYHLAAYINRGMPWTDEEGKRTTCPYCGYDCSYEDENRGSCVEPDENLHGFHTPRGDWPDRPHPNDGLSYRFDHDTDEWVYAMNPETGLLIVEADPLYSDDAGDYDPTHDKPGKPDPNAPLETP